jgi:hypothetical protein
VSDKTAAYPLSDRARGAALAALRAYLFETQRYIDGARFTPCAPDCEHCAPKVAHFTEVRTGLVERSAAITEALDALSGNPDETSS